MQQRRLRPGDVLDDYCPRERRVTDHAIVAMIDDTIQQTRCVVCDAEHEYKQARVPAQRRKKAPALFSQVLDGLKAPARPPHAAEVAEAEPAAIDAASRAPATAGANASPASDAHDASVSAVAAPVDPIAIAETSRDDASGESESEHTDSPERADRQDGPFRRQLIRAALPRPEGVTPPAGAVPEFTIRQPMGRAGRHGSPGRRRGHGQGHGQNAPPRFGRSGSGQRFNGSGRSSGHGGPNANRAGGSRRGGKKR